MDVGEYFCAEATVGGRRCSRWFVPLEFCFVWKGSFGEANAHLSPDFVASRDWDPSHLYGRRRILLLWGHWVPKVFPSVCPIRILLCLEGFARRSERAQMILRGSAPMRRPLLPSSRMTSGVPRGVGRPFLRSFLRSC